MWKARHRVVLEEAVGEQCSEAVDVAVVEQVVGPLHRCCVVHVRPLLLFFSLARVGR